MSVPHKANWHFSTLKRQHKLFVTITNKHSCRSRQNSGDAKNFCPNFPKLPRKVFVRLLSTNFLPQRLWRRFLVWPSNKGFHLCFLQTLCAIFWNQTILGVIFTRSFRDFAQIFRDFAVFFNKSKLLGGRLHTLLSAS